MPPKLLRLLLLFHLFQTPTTHFCTSRSFLVCVFCFVVGLPRHLPNVFVSMWLLSTTWFGAVCSHSANGNTLECMIAKVYHFYAVCEQSICTPQSRFHGLYWGKCESSWVNALIQSSLRIQTTVDKVNKLLCTRARTLAPHVRIVQLFTRFLASLLFVFSSNFF